jgi:hypothetical protein
MGGFISFLISVLAILTFYLAGSTIMLGISIVVGIVCLFSWFLMWYFARLLARDRIFVKELHRGEFSMDSPEAHKYWKNLKITVSKKDIEDIPNWITAVNMLATCFAIILLVWGAISYFN